MPAERRRADAELVERGLAESREKARALIMAGQAYSGEKKIEKPSELIAAEAELHIKGGGPRYVSRGALKLEKGLAVFGVRAQGRTAMDLGASTGGFTDVLLQNGASLVYAVDVGYGQLDWKLRNDPRVRVMERFNARYVTAGDFDVRPTLAVMDVSFISITKILPAACAVLGDGGEFITLIKPQFEAGRERVGKKGVVRDPAVHMDVVEMIRHFVREEVGWVMHQLSFSPITGPEGNIEFLAHLTPGGAEVPEEAVENTVREAHLSLGRKADAER